MLNFAESVLDFTQHCRHEKNLSPKTLTAYTIDLEQFEKFLSINISEAQIMKIDKYVLKKYLEHLSQYKPKTIKRKIATLKAFFNYHEFEENIISNPFRKIKIKIKDPKTLPEVLQISEIRNILSAAYVKRGQCVDHAKYGAFELTRNIIVLELLFATGVRVTELSHLKFNDVNLSAGFIKVNGKGSQERIIQICDKELLSILKAYLTCLNIIFPTSSEYFLVNRIKKRLSEQSIRILVRKVTEEAGIIKRVTPHIFRHSIATLLIGEGVDITYIQKLLGHSSITTTQLYTHLSNEQQKAVLKHKHPRRHIRMTVHAE